jgi:SAM-dependent methyltransferase
VAEAYERFRPGYPTRLLDVVAGYTQGGLASALEVGAGTGLATRLFAGTGLAVTASEPDADMLDVLRRRTVGLPVTPLLSAFEELPMTRRYDLLYAAAAWHWTDPHGRWQRVAGLLRPGGTFATFGGPTEIADPGLKAAVNAARRAILPVDDVPSPDGTAAEAPLQWPATELLREPSFRDVEQHEIPRTWETTPVDYLGLLSTVSAYLCLDVVDRAEVLSRIMDVLPDRFALTATIVVHLARRTHG